MSGNVTQVQQIFRKKEQEKGKRVTNSQFLLIPPFFLEILRQQWRNLPKNKNLVNKT